MKTKYLLHFLVGKW